MDHTIDTLNYYDILYMCLDKLYILGLDKLYIHTYIRTYCVVFCTYEHTSVVN